MKTATVWIDPITRMVAVRTPYDQFFVASLKVQIPAANRRWDQERKIWLVEQSSMDVLEKLLAALSYKVESAELPHEIAPTSSDSPYHALLEGVPKNVLREVFRLLVMRCHPDRGGSNELMAKINKAWKEIERES